MTSILDVYHQYREGFDDPKDLLVRLTAQGFSPYTAYEIISILQKESIRYWQAKNIANSECCELLRENIKLHEEYNELTEKYNKLLEVIDEQGFNEA